MALSAERSTESRAKPEVRYKGLFERTVNKNVDGRSRVTKIEITDPDSDEMKNFVEEGERGSLTIFTLDGTLVHSMTTSARAAQATMKACNAGTYKPLPELKKGQI